jgi:hypothetical protein
MLFGGCEEVAALLGGGEENGEGGGGEEPGNEPSSLVPVDPALPSYYVNANAEDSGDGKSAATAFKTLEEAYAAAKTDNVRKQIVVLSDLAVADNEEILLEGDGNGFITIYGASTGERYKIERNIGPDATQGGAKPSVLKIADGAKIRLVNINVEGKATGDNRAILVTGAGTEVGLANAAVTGRSSGNWNVVRHGSGILVDTGAKLVMYADSEVTNCVGKSNGAVYVNTGGTFVMNEGSQIYKNSSSHGGGVGVGTGGSFSLNGGKIHNNIADVANGRNGGGLYVNGGTVEISAGGEISGNTAKEGGGIFMVGGGTLMMTSGTISGNKSKVGGINGGSGGGVFIEQGTFTMDGGEISGNEAEEKGGGVFVYEQELGSGNATFIMTGGTIYGKSETDESLRNVSKKGDTNGHAIYRKSDNYANQSIVTIKGIVSKDSEGDNSTTYWDTTTKGK